MRLSTLLFVSVLALAACRDGDSAGPTPTPSSKATATKPTAPATPPPTTSQPSTTPQLSNTPQPPTTQPPTTQPPTTQPPTIPELPAPTPATTSVLSWSFESDRAGAAPAGFSFGRTGSGPPGSWIIRAAPDAPSAPNVLAQLHTDDTKNRFPIAVADAPPLADVRVSVKCKFISGEVDQACGLVFRYRDEKNYYLTRVNALENKNNVGLYCVKRGKHRQLASWTGRVARNAWHDYAVEARGDHLQVFLDGKRKPILDHHDSTFPDAGRIGVSTKSDSITHFDDLAVSPL